MASYHGTPWYPKVFFQKVWCLTSSKHFCNWSYHSSINFCVYTANTTIWKLKKRIFWNIKKKSAEILLLILISWFGVFGEWWVPNGVFIAHLSNGTQNFLPSHFCLFSNQWRFLKPTTFFDVWKSTLNGTQNFRNFYYQKVWTLNFLTHDLP